MYKSIPVIALLLSTAACAVSQQPAPYVDKSNEDFSRSSSGRAYGGAKPIYSDNDYMGNDTDIESRPLMPSEEVQSTPLNRNDGVIDFSNSAQNSGNYKTGQSHPIVSDYIDSEPTSVRLAPVQNNFGGGAAHPVLDNSATTKPNNADYLNLNQVNKFNSPSSGAQTEAKPDSASKLLRAKPFAKPTYKEAVEAPVREVAAPAPVETPAPIAEQPKADKIEIPALPITKAIEPAAPAKIAEPAAKPAPAPAPATAKSGEETIEKAPIVTEAKPSAESTGKQFIRPVAGEIIGKFGNEADGTFNDGINIKADKGSDVKAADAGEIVYSGNQLQGYGNMIIIRHANGYLTSYAHLEGLDLKKGATVKQGTVIGHVGDTGNVSEPMLHFGVREGREPVDPQQFLK